VVLCRQTEPSQGTDVNELLFFAFLCWLVTVQVLRLMEGYRVSRNYWSHSSGVWGTRQYRVNYVIAEHGV